MLLLPILFLFATLALVRATDDQHMLELSRARAGSIYADHSFTYRHLSSLPLLATPDLAATAWEHALTDGVVYTATLQAKGKKDVPYFFSVIHPGSTLGRSMRMWHHPPQGQHKYAAVLWKWHEGRPELVHVDLVPFEQGIRWPLMDVHSLIKGL
ncbi:hypothetical protein PSEUBRA_006165 [Kalmanozyma brasiliensis GHG001]|uniref:uncharacterized protein n=1 Tax=Kalmanozyma brasiliensis (strain GHG001) TaxID=1365824 RepID=UPI001CE88697|nr:uncharacterized protein PSEUBRA_006165 [Kalmanozyma brasiliensis GHG001]KAF6767636.1 hypothetical protein PSEUBRA_006165 [Kalmanozyma brasiliensis GHG001]